MVKSTHFCFSGGGGRSIHFVNIQKQLFPLVLSTPINVTIKKIANVRKRNQS